MLALFLQGPLAPPPRKPHGALAPGVVAQPVLLAHAPVLAVGGSAQRSCELKVRYLY